MTNRYSPHKAFVEKLRSQAAFDSISSADAPTALSNDGLYSEELMKELEVKFDALFANLEDD